MQSKEYAIWKRTNLGPIQDPLKPSASLFSPYRCQFCTSCGSDRAFEVNSINMRRRRWRPEMMLWSELCHVHMRHPRWSYVPSGWHLLVRNVPRGTQILHFQYFSQRFSIVFSQFNSVPHPFSQFEEFFGSFFHYHFLVFFSFAWFPLQLLRETPDYLSCNFSHPKSAISDGFSCSISTPVKLPVSSARLRFCLCHLDSVFTSIA